MNLHKNRSTIFVYCIYLIGALINAALTYEIKCSHGNNVHSLSCQFNYIADNTTLKSELPNDFDNFTSYVTQLSLGISNLSTIPADTFVLFPNLEALVARADLTSINKQQFINATKLALLNFGYNNRLTKLEANLFQYVPTLEYIDLGYNLISEIENGAFEGLAKVKTVYLEANLLHVISNGTFAGAKNVKKLDLSGNQIAELEDGAFAGMQQLKRLQLNRNRIEKLQAVIFQGLRSVEFIDLSLNAISEIEDGTFDDLVKLLTLELAFNRITVLQSSLFDGAANLKSLFLAYNGIENIDTPFSNSTQLKLLDLSHNAIGYIDPMVFSNAAHLESLELRDCNLTKIPEDLFLEQNQLEVLDLSENTLTTLDLNDFGTLKKLRVLKLEATGLAEFQNFTEIKELMPSLEFINLARNEIDCDTIAPMIEYFTNHTIEYEFGEEVDVGCRLLPFQSRALQVYQLSQAKFFDRNQLDGFT